MDNQDIWHIYRQILRMLRMRTAAVLRIDEDKVSTQSVGDLVNILFLMNGQYGCVGDYNVTLRALHTLLGDLLWTKPDAALENSQASTLVQ